MSQVTENRWAWRSQLRGTVDVIWAAYVDRWSTQRAPPEWCETEEELGTTKDSQAGYVETPRMIVMRFLTNLVVQSLEFEV